MPSIVLFAASTLLAGLSPQAPEAEEPSPLESRIDTYVTDRRAIGSFWDLVGSPERERRLAALEESSLAGLAAVQFDALSRTGQVDWLLLRTRIERDRARRAREARRAARLAHALPFAQELIALEEARWTLAPIDRSRIAARFEALAAGVQALKERLRSSEVEEDEADEAAHAAAQAEAAEGASGADDGALPLVLGASDALFVAERVEGARAAIRRWYEHGAAFEPGFAWWLERPKAELDDALEAYRKALREEVAGQKGEDDDPLVGDPIGREALVEDLAFEWIPYTPEELFAIGERELAWCEAELRKAALELGFGDDWKAAVEHVKGLFVEPGRQDELVAEQARAALDFLDEHALVSVPELCAATWRVRMLSEGEQETLPFAAYGGQVMLVAYPTADMDHAAKLEVMRGNNEHFTRAVTPHELVPGHHLQGYQSRRYATQRRAFRTPFLVEGWALHWEMVEWELGWPRGPEDRVGMLFWRAHRAARILVSLGFHLGQMSPEEMIELLVERVGHERDNATAEVRRYVGPAYGPLYQCAYMLGGLQLQALRRELVGAGGWTERAFHDAVLRQNAIPIELIRAQLAELPLTPETRTAWRFDRGG